MVDPDALSRWKESVLAESERLGPDDKFRFRCHPDIACFNSCCADVNIFLTPYCVLRLKNRLGLDSKTFLERHTRTLVLDQRGVPAVQLKMNEDEKQTCPFVGPEGCTVYEDRPWACRMYPLGAASPPPEAKDEQPFYFVVEQIPGCAGFEDPKEWTVREWKSNQGIDEYEARGELFKAVCLHKFFHDRNCLSPDKGQMLRMASFDLDTFRRFVFESSFLKRFDVEPELAEKLRTDDEALLIFGFRWLRFTLFGEKTLVVTDKEFEAGVQRLGKAFTK